MLPYDMYEFPNRRAARHTRALPGEISLAGPVGAGGANRPDDVAAVQAALNAVPAAFNGAEPALKVDSLVGPKTRGAIAAFQQGWLAFSDSRIDPNGPSLRCLNLATGTPARLVDGDLPARATGPAAALWSGFATAPSAAQGIAAFELARSKGVVGAGAGKARPTILDIVQAQIRLDELRDQHLPNAFRVANRAQSRAEHALDYAQRLASPARQLPGFNARTAPDRLAFLLLAKHFHLSEREPARAVAAATDVLSLIRRVRLRTIARRGSFGALFDQSDIYVANYRRVPQAFTAAGYTFAGGDRLHRNSGNGSVPAFPPREKIERLDRIYLTPLWDAMTPDSKTVVLLHELCHFLGGTDASGRAVVDFAYANQQSRYRALTPAQRLRNADTYALYMTEGTFGTARAAASAGTDVRTLGAFPFVEASGETVLPEPPDGQPDLFAFPASFK